MGVKSRTLPLELSLTAKDARLLSRAAPGRLLAGWSRRRDIALDGLAFFGYAPPAGMPDRLLCGDCL